MRVPRHSVLRLMLCLIAVAGLFAAVGVEAAAKVRSAWQLRALAGPAGSVTQMNGIANTGVAVGTTRLSTGSQHGVVWDGKRFKDINSRLGASSSITGVNDRSQIAGWRSAHATANLTDLLLGRGDSATHPRAFFMSGKTLKVRPEPSAASAVNILGVVTGRFRAADGQLHAFAWRAGGPLPKRGRARAAQAGAEFVDLGRGDGMAIDHRNTIVGNRDGAAGSWSYDSSTLTWTFRPAGFQGNLYGIDSFRRAVGARDLPNGQYEPVVLDLARGGTKVLGQPSSAQPQDALIRGISAGFYFGLFQRQDNSSGPLLWDANGRLVNVQSLVQPASLRVRYRIDSITDVDTNGLMTGVLERQGVGFQGFVLYPPPLQKVDYIEELVARYGTRSDRRELAKLRRYARLAASSRRKTRRRGCRGLRSIRSYLATEYDNAEGEDDAGFIDEIGAAVWELEGELGCGRRLRLSLPVQPL